MRFRYDWTMRLEEGFDQVAAKELEDLPIPKNSPMISADKELIDEPELVNVEKQTKNSEPSFNRQVSEPSMAANVPKIEEETEVVQEIVEEKKIETQPVLAEADLAEFETAPTGMKEKQRKQEVGRSEDAIVLDGIMVRDVSLQDFDNYFQNAFAEEFNEREIKALKKEVVLQFDLVNSAVANFKITPSQTSEINVRMLELVKKGLNFLPKDLKGYEIDLGEL